MQSTSLGGLEDGNPKASIIPFGIMLFDLCLWNYAHDVGRGGNGGSGGSGGSCESGESGGGGGDSGGRGAKS